jgi:glycosyltransferase involved in cell wall biosynthesis
MTKKMKKNILCVIEGVNFGGQQLMMYNIFKQIINYDTNNEFNFDLVYLFDDSESSVILEKYASVFRNVKSLNFPSRSKYYYLKRPFTALKKIFEFAKLVRANKYDIVMSNGFNTAFLTSLLKNVNTGFIHYRFIGGDLSKNELYSFGKLYCLLGLYKNVDLFLAWPEMLSYLRSKNIRVNTIEGLDFIVHVDCDLFKPKDVRDFRFKLGIDPMSCVIGWVGRIDPDPDSLAVFETLELCNFLNIKFPDFNFKFLVIGDGQNKVKLLECIERFNLSDKTIVLPPKNQEDLVNYYNIIDIEVLLDDDPQGGSHLREAMACGRVALSVNGPSGVQTRLIEDSITGILVNPNNRVEESAQRIVSLTDQQKYIIGKNAVNFVNKFSYESKAKLIYNRMLIDIT